MVERCKKCGLSRNDVLNPENFHITDEGLCLLCAMEKYQIAMDYGSNNEVKHFSDMEEMNYSMCIEAAKEAGYTEEQAMNCDAGDLKCQNCPWR